MLLSSLRVLCALCGEYFMRPQLSEYDCIVIGGGPSGSTTAALVADAGFRVLLLERDVEPRRKVGESLMPETYWVFERLGVLEAMKKGPFVQKVGRAVRELSGRESSPFLFTQHDPRECSRTWHVERAKFDQFLLKMPQRKVWKCIAARGCSKLSSKASARSACAWLPTAKTAKSFALR